MTNPDDDKAAAVIAQHMLKCPLKQDLSDKETAIWIKGLCAGIEMAREQGFVQSGPPLSPEDESRIFHKAEATVDRVMANSKQG